MADYKAMYYELMFEINKIIDQLLEVQKKCDAIYNATASLAEKREDDRPL